MMEYRGYVATVEFDDSAGVLHGRVVNCGSYPIATFESTDAQELRREFKRSVDEYLAWCREDGATPKQPFPTHLHSGPEECSTSGIATVPSGHLLSLMGDILRELRTRDICRSENLPTEDFAEYLFCRAFDWQREANSKRGFDATDDSGTRYQIKGRRLTTHGRSSRQLSAIRGLDQFDFLAAVLFNETYGIQRAALVPIAEIRERSKFVPHTNSHKFQLTDEIWDAPQVRDVTDILKAAYLDL